MIRVNGNKIRMTRGDSLCASVVIKRNGETYTPVEGDRIRFAMSKAYKSENRYELLLTKEIPYDTLLLELYPEETADLEYGTYNYDIEMTSLDGRVDTFISSTITLAKEVL